MLRVAARRPRARAARSPTSSRATGVTYACAPSPQWTSTKSLQGATRKWRRMPKRRACCEGAAVEAGLLPHAAREAVGADQKPRAQLPARRLGVERARLPRASAAARSRERTSTCARRAAEQRPRELRPPHAAHRGRVANVPRRARALDEADAAEGRPRRRASRRPARRAPRRPAGMRPSPHGLVERRRRCSSDDRARARAARAPMAVARPAGPAPATSEVSCARARASHRGSVAPCEREPRARHLEREARQQGAPGGASSPRGRGVAASPRADLAARRARQRAGREHVHAARR